MKLTSLLAAVCLVATPLSGASAEIRKPLEATSGSKSGEAGSERICKKWMRTGSRIASARVCKSRAEWDKEMFQMRLNLDQTLANMRVLSGPQGRDAIRICVSC